MKNYPILIFCLASTTMFAQQAAQKSSSGASGGTAARGAASAAATQGGSAVTGSPVISGGGAQPLQQPLGVTTPITQQSINGTDTERSRFPAGISPEQRGAFPANRPAEERGQLPQSLPSEQRGQFPTAQSDDRLDTPSSTTLGQPVGGAVNVSGVGRGTITEPSGATVQERSQQLAEQRQFSENLRTAIFSSGTNFVIAPQNNGVITVISQNGLVTLQGTANTAQERLEIEQRVRSVADVVRVNNQIVVLGDDGGAVLIGSPTGNTTTTTNTSGGVAVE